MTWLSEFQDAAGLRERTLKSLSVPVGLANPMWLAFGAAATAGAAWWMMTRWARPANLEAAAAEPAAAPAIAAPMEAPLAPETPAAVVVAAIEAPAPVHVETVQEKIAVAAARLEDDLTQLVGVGPRTAQALMDRGVKTFADLAAWSGEQMAAFDAELKLKGRSVRDAWLDQARKLSTGG